MSFSNAPDLDTLGFVAGALGVDEAFVEKDWFVVRAIGILLAHGTKDLSPVFSGGTSLLKGHGLIRRFSEDIDFKLDLSAAFLAKSQNQQRSTLSVFKKALKEVWTEAGFKVEITKVGSGNGFIQFDMDYPSKLEPHESLRPHIQVEISAKPPRLQPIERSVMSFVNQYRDAGPEIASVPCVDPVETAADKLSAFCWRTLSRERGDDTDDPTIIRHLHDLAALESVAAVSHAFAALLAETLASDASRGKGLTDMRPQDRLDAMLAKLADDPLYASEYAQFVSGMAFAGEPEIPTFSEATRAISRLCRLLPDE